ncbi:DUF4884 domain-containing protein [Dysgonomonas sp. 25]|uniref:DUF4884 domain-containing protein n=1 Tax=Dysgonomonas sp. 25 TaxID=2302933 RepID=UPI0013D08F7E|nr:DUF4884 domain-containing protein [Dysgonomonas sp. 25]NDV69143.1 DUF4884 domain-containing protein [Dysgonomonas sp. 25]
MRKLFYLFPVLLCLCAFYSCFGLSGGTYYGQALREERPGDNPSYRVEYLFEHDGCKVYRFYDRGNYVYFTNCKGNITAIANDSTQTRIQTVTNVED